MHEVWPVVWQVRRCLTVLKMVQVSDCKFKFLHVNHADSYVHWDVPEEQGLKYQDDLRLCL